MFGRTAPVARFLWNSPQNNSTLYLFTFVTLNSENFFLFSIPPVILIFQLYYAHYNHSQIFFQEEGGAPLPFCVKNFFSRSLPKFTLRKISFVIVRVKKKIETYSNERETAGHCKKVWKQLFLAHISHLWKLFKGIISPNFFFSFWTDFLEILEQYVKLQIIELSVLKIQKYWIIAIFSCLKHDEGKPKT